MKHEVDLSEGFDNMASLESIYNSIETGMPYDDKDLFSGNPDEKLKFLTKIANRIGVSIEEILSKDFQYFYDFGVYVYENYYESIEEKYLKKCAEFLPTILKPLFESYEAEGFSRNRIKKELLDVLSDSFDFGFIWCGLSAEFLDAENPEEIKIQNLLTLDTELYEGLELSNHID